MPVAGRDLRQQREDGVAEVARPRDQLPGLTGDEPVRLRVVDLAAGDRLDERDQVGRIHLVVGRHHADDVEPFLERALVAGDDRGADAAVPLARDELDARIGRRADGLGRPVGGGVVDDEDPVDELGDAGQRRSDQPLLVVGGDDDRDALPVDHGSGGSGAAGEERIGEERRRAAEQEPEQGADQGAVAAAARRRLDRGRRLDDLCLLDVLGERELLLHVRLEVEQLAAPRLGVVERADEDELVERGEPRLVRPPPRAARSAARACSAAPGSSSSWSLKALIFVSTYFAEVRSITSFASASAAFSALPGWAATTLIVTSGAPVGLAPGPEAPTIAEVTLPRSARTRRPDAREAASSAASERTISETARAFVRKLCTGAPPFGENGWPIATSVSAS